MITEKFKTLCEQMSEHTKCECGGPGCAPFERGGCCSSMDCANAFMLMKNLGVDLTPKLVQDDGEESCISFMGMDGCTLDPWERPVCTVHTCQINSLGVKVDLETQTVDKPWTDKYFELRQGLDAELHVIAGT